MEAELQPQAEELVRSRLGEKAAELFAQLLSRQPEKADAIVLLQGDRLDRAPKAAELFHQGFAPLVFMPGNNEPRPDDNDVVLEELQRELGSRGVPAGAIELDGQAGNTAEQAQRAIGRALERGWKRMLVVTAPYHALRAFLAFQKAAEERGWRGQIIMQATDVLWEAVPGGRSRSALEMLELGIQKILRDGFDTFISSATE